MGFPAFLRRLRKPLFYPLNYGDGCLDLPWLQRFRRF